MPITAKQIDMAEQIKTAIVKARAKGLRIERVANYGAYIVCLPSDLPFWHMANKKNRTRITSASKLLEFLEKQQ